MKKEAVQQINIADYHYPLPDAKIAKYPLFQRDESKLLCFRDAQITSCCFRDLPQLLPQGSLLLFNNTRVIHARLLFRKATGAQIEVFCLSPYLPADYVVNFRQNKSCSWRCMIGNAKRWKKEPLTLEIATQEGGVVTLTARKNGLPGSETIVDFSWNDHRYTFSELLEMSGKLPIPPYLNRPSEERDNETYQTVYARIEGSVAAPTAGLHFTPEVMQRLAQKGIQSAAVTLHVGAGTFKPVKSPTIAGHEMHTEFISVARETVERLFDHSGRLIVVGTTSMRTVESLYYIGKKLKNHPDISMDALAVEQWEAYDNTPEISPQEALQHILRYLDRIREERLVSATRLMIAPGYSFHYPDAIVTNFHQPQSTLLLLIAAFVGDEWRNIYHYALHNDFRFLSYGDSSLLWKKSK